MHHHLLVDFIRKGLRGTVTRETDLNRTMEQFRGRVLPESVGKRLETMCALGRLDLAELDERAFDELKELNEDAALVVLEHFANSDLSHVQNKSAFLCGMIKTHGEKQQQGTTQNDLPAAQADQGGADEEKVRELLDRTGYSLDISKGQRKYGGPPPGWEGPPPPTGASVTFFKNVIIF